MKQLIHIDRNVISGQCKGALLRVQVRYTAIFFGVGFIPSWYGMQVGLFAPRHSPMNGYSCTKFYGSFMMGKDIPIIQKPRIIRWLNRALRFNV